jgi:acyl-CoA synthetase (AMP-forming)/AMP-acid ligase II
MKGYWGKEDATKEVLDEDGWFVTGDMGKRDDDGYYFIVDRKKEMIIRGGYNVYPREIEEVLYEHPAVAEAAVIGVAHRKWAERPLACVVVRPGSELTKEDLLAFLGDRVAKWWLPDDVVFVDEVPKTSVGKFSKKTLRERFVDYKLPTEGA